MYIALAIEGFDFVLVRNCTMVNVESDRTRVLILLQYYSPDKLLKLKTQIRLLLDEYPPPDCYSKTTK